MHLQKFKCFAITYQNFCNYLSKLSGGADIICRSSFPISMYSNSLSSPIRSIMFRILSQILSHHSSIISAPCSVSLTRVTLASLSSCSFIISPFASSFFSRTATLAVLIHIFSLIIPAVTGSFAVYKMRSTAPSPALVSSIQRKSSAGWHSCIFWKILWICSFVAIHILLSKYLT